MTQFSVSIFLLGMACAIIFPELAGSANSGVSSKTNLTAIPNTSLIWTQSLVDTPNNFLGVECYHLEPETVTREACQPLFDRLFVGGHVYEERQMSNKRLFRFAYDPCVIMISSPTRGDRRVTLSIADVVLYAIEVLRACEKISTGGAYTFKGTWQVVVTRNPTQIAHLDNTMSEE